MTLSKFFIRFKGRKVYLFEDNVRTICPNCGQEHAVDIAEAAGTDGFDLYGTTVYCEACSQEANKRMRGMGGQHIPVSDLGMKA